MSDVQACGVDAEMMGGFGLDLSFLKGFLPNIDGKKALAALLNAGVPGLVAYLQEQAAKTPNPLDDVAVKYIGQALTAWLASLLHGPSPEPRPMGTAVAEVAEAQRAGRRQQIEDYVRERGGDPAKLNPIVVQILLSLAWPLIEKLLDKWLSQQPQ